MARGVGYESLAALVDYLTKEEEDRQVPLSALADAAQQGIGQVPLSALADQLGTETPVDQTIRGFNDLRRQAGRGMMQLGEDIRGSRSMQARDPMEEVATIPGHLLANTLQGAGYLTQFGEEDWEGLKTAAGTVAEEAMDPKYIEGGWVRPTAKAVQPYVEEPYKIAQEMSVGDVLPGAGLLAKIGMAVPMGLAAKVAKVAKKPSIEIGATDVHDQVGGESFASKILSVDGVPKAGADLSIYGDKVYIQHVQTVPDAQRQGYAKQLIDNLIEEHPDKKIALTLMTDEGEQFFSNTYDIADDMTIAPKGAAKAVPEPPRRSLLERLAEGVEDPGALERGRLEVGDKVLRPDYDEDHHDKLLRQLNEALANNDTEAIKKGEDELAKMLLVEPVTPEIESQRISQLAALDALEPVEKARLDRAVEQGFDLDAFHGTKGDIEAFDPGLLGETTNAPSARLGFFFSADAKTAGTYATTARVEDVRPDINEAKQAARDRQDSLILEEGERRLKGEDTTKLKAQIKSLKAEINTFDYAFGGQNIIPVKLRLQNPLEHDFKGNGYRDTSYRTLLEQAKNKGHDGAIFRNTTDGGGMTDIYVVFEPAQIRSRFAAFDPKDTPKTGLRQNAKLANEALQVNRKQLEVLVERKKAVEREFSDLWAVPDLFNKKAELALAGKKSPALQNDMLELSNNIKALQDRMDLLEDEARKVTIGTGDITASFAPLVLPLGGGTAAAAYLANQEQE